MNRLQHAEAYCPVTNAWRNVASMNKPRSNFGIEVVDEQILVVGGYNGRQTSSDVEAYDDTANEWLIHVQYFSKTTFMKPLNFLYNAILQYELKKI